LAPKHFRLGENALLRPDVGCRDRAGSASAL